jgi:hypothetical protein
MIIWETLAKKLIFKAVVVDKILLDQKTVELKRTDQFLSVKTINIFVDTTIFFGPTLQLCYRQALKGLSYEIDFKNVDEN